MPPSALSIGSAGPTFVHVHTRFGPLPATIDDMSLIWLKAYIMHPARLPASPSEIPTPQQLGEHQYGAAQAQVHLQNPLPPEA